MSEKEAERGEILARVKRKELKLKHAAVLMGVSYRHAKRLWKSYKLRGKQGLVSKARGKRSNRATPAELEERIIELVSTDYYDFGPTLAAEKLEEWNGIKISSEKLRLLMIANGLWQPKRVRKVKTHQRRPRRSQRGELVQVDGSPHAWLEERGPSSTLYLAVDDATGEILAGRFEPTETTAGYMRMFTTYIRNHGLPVMLYGDRSTIFYTSHGQTKQKTQFTRAMEQLGTKITCANSPQAKGRVERKNGVLQDRLVKELRLRGFSTLDEANRFLPLFFAEFNRKFAKAPANPHDAHRPLKQNVHLERVLALHHKRKITKNLEVQYENRIFQIQEPNRARRLRHQGVTVIETLTGDVHLDYKGELLRFTEFQEHDPQPPILNHKEIGTPNLPRRRWKPSRYHPWKSSYKSSSPRL